MTLPFPSIEDSCFAPVDLQKTFCDPKRFVLFLTPNGNEATHNVAIKTSGIAAEFNRVGMDIAWIYCDNEISPMSRQQAIRDLYVVKPATNDSIIPKIEDSAFDSPRGEFNNYLFQNRKKNIFLSGVNLNACVYWTARGALAKGYNVFLISDLCADGYYAIDEAGDVQGLDLFQQNMQYYTSKKHAADFGRIHYTTSDEVMAHYCAAKPALALTA